MWFHTTASDLFPFLLFTTPFIETEEQQPTNTAMSLKSNTQTCRVMKIIYQKYLGTSTRVSCALSIWKNIQVKGLNESRLTEGRRILVLSRLRRFWQVSSYSFHRLISQSATLQERSVQGCRRAKYKFYSPLDDAWVIWSTSKVFNYFRSRRDASRCAVYIPALGEDWITEERRLGGIFLL